MHKFLDKVSPVIFRIFSHVARIALTQGYPRLIVFWFRLVFSAIIIVFAVESKAKIEILGGYWGILLLLLAGMKGIKYKARFSAEARKGLLEIRSDLNSHLGTYGD